jgi:hypothetical protein
MVLMLLGDREEAMAAVAAGDTVGGENSVRRGVTVGGERTFLRDVAGDDEHEDDIAWRHVRRFVY